MRLFEMKTRPKKAGVAKLTFEGNDSSRIRRTGKDITLSANLQAEFFPLLSGRQFVYCYGGNSWYFGGTDENPFLVRLNSDAGYSMLQRGEQGFFDWLKPTEVSVLEKKWNTPAIRQGDWFAIKSPHTDKEISQAIKVLYGMTRDIQEFRSSALEGTRHEFTGTKVSIPERKLGFFCGTLTAPDHSPKDLSDGLYALIQCDKLYSPKTAD